MLEMWLPANDLQPAVGCDRVIVIMPLGNDESILITKFEKIDFLKYQKKQKKLNLLYSINNKLKYSTITFDNYVAFSNGSRTTSIENVTPIYFELVVNS